MAGGQGSTLTQKVNNKPKRDLCSKCALSVLIPREAADDLNRKAVRIIKASVQLFPGILC